MNKKQIVKKAVGKYKGQGGPGISIVDRLKRMREEDDRGMRIKTGEAKTPTPFGLIGGTIRGTISKGVEGIKQKMKDRILAQKNFSERENNKDYYKSYKSFLKK